MGNLLDYSEFEAVGGSIYKWDLRNGRGVKVSVGTYILVGKFTDKKGVIRLFKKTIGIKK